MSSHQEEIQKCKVQDFHPLKNKKALHVSKVSGRLPLLLFPHFGLIFLIRNRQAYFVSCLVACLAPGDILLILSFG